MWASCDTLRCVQALKNWQTGVVGTLCACQISDQCDESRHTHNVRSDWKNIHGMTPTRGVQAWGDTHQSGPKGEETPHSVPIDAANELHRWPSMVSIMVIFCSPGCILSTTISIPIETKKTWRKPQVWVTDPSAHCRVCCCARVVRKKVIFSR